MVPRTAAECRAEAERLRAHAIENPKFAEGFLAVAGGFDRLADVIDVARWVQLAVTPTVSDARN
jgi:hypothetical protein